MGLASLLRLVFCESEVCASPLQGGHHLIRRNLSRVIDHRVDFTEASKTVPHLFDAFQPLQG